MSSASNEGEHVYTDDGEWVLVQRTADGRLVDADGEPVVPGSARTEAYVGTKLIDGERHHEFIDTATGETVLYDDTFEVSDATGEEAPLAALPTFGMHDGELVRIYPTEDGSELVLGADGTSMAVAPQERGDFPTFESYAQYNGHRCVVATDADGDRQLYTMQGDVIERSIDWSDVEPVDVDAFAGQPVAIGDYTFEGGVEAQVYLFSSGAQAIRNQDGGYEPVIVPTDAEYPDGRAFFEGTFTTGHEPGMAQTPVDAFSFADGQTAYLVDGELVLVDSGLTATYPDGAPVDCGDFPSGNLFVLPDGRQMIQADDGSWSLGNLPGIDSYDVLVERYEAVADDDVDTTPDDDGGPGRDLDLGLLDDITTVPGGLGRSAAADPGDTADEGEGDGGLDAEPLPDDVPMLHDVVVEPGLVGDVTQPGSDFGVRDFEFSTDVDDAPTDELDDPFGGDLDDG